MSFIDTYETIYTLNTYNLNSSSSLKLIKHSFDTYLSNINISINNDLIKNIYQYIIDYYYKYNNNPPPKIIADIIKNIFDTIINNFEIIIRFIKQKEDQDLLLKYYYKFIIILISYYYYVFTIYNFYVYYNHNDQQPQDFNMNALFDSFKDYQFLKINEYKNLNINDDDDDNTKLFKILLYEFSFNIIEFNEENYEKFKQLSIKDEDINESINHLLNLQINIDDIRGEYKKKIGNYIEKLQELNKKIKKERERVLIATNEEKIKKEKQKKIMERLRNKKDKKDEKIKRELEEFDALRAAQGREDRDTEINRLVEKIKESDKKRLAEGREDRDTEIKRKLEYSNAVRKAQGRETIETELDKLVEEIKKREIQEIEQELEQEQEQERERQERERQERERQEQEKEQKINIQEYRKRQKEQQEKQMQEYIEMQKKRQEEIQKYKERQVNIVNIGDIKNNVFLFNQIQILSIPPDVPSLELINNILEHINQYIDSINIFNNDIIIKKLEKYFSTNKDEHFKIIFTKIVTNIDFAFQIIVKYFNAIIYKITDKEIVTKYNNCLFNIFIILHSYMYYCRDLFYYIKEKKPDETFFDYQLNEKEFPYREFPEFIKAKQSSNILILYLIYTDFIKQNDTISSALSVIFERVNDTNIIGFNNDFIENYLDYINKANLDKYIATITAPLKKQIYMYMDIIIQIRNYNNNLGVVRGGKNKKINIMNNKTKKIIQRVVYIDNNKNKYIRLNNKEDLLSNFKYNKKEKYYYKK
jgi:hypothetical protein